MSAQKNSFVTIAEQIQLLNNNAVEIMTKLNSIVTSKDSTINVTQIDSDGNETTYAMPTVGKLQSDINVLNNNVKTLAGLNDNSAQIINGQSTKKIYLADLNREPNRIDFLNPVTQFSSTNNWFFESLMNPIISINFDLTDKIENAVDGVISRRYIVRFERDTDNNYTENGLRSKNDFTSKFINKSDINLKDFTDWHINPTNTGVVDNKNLLYDEQYFEFDYQEVQEHGIFSVLKQETDTINNKLWFHIYPFKYTTITGEERVIKAGDELILNRQDSITRWSILETSVASSDFRVRLERIEGFDPIPTGANVLKFYGSKMVKKTVKVSVGFDEYLVVFMKPTNRKNNIKGSVWSQGTALYTNDLVLDTDSNVSMAQYYLNTVYDYGQVLKDMVVKTIPSKFGIKPNAPELNSDNFKVVQINKHLTDTSDSKEIKDLHSQKNQVKTRLDQINSAISQKNKELSVTKYQSVAEQNKAQNELTKLIQEQESQSKLLYSLTTQIKSKTDTINKVDAKFRVRGFWAMPAPQQEQGYREQEVVQFEIQYRYSAKNGLENQTEGYTVVDGDQTKTGYFSNWVPLKSDLRKRSYDESSQTWVWEIDDISDADTPNINQLDIAIQQGEKVEIRVASISEVGYPDSILQSDWSNILTVEFPDDLNNILDQNDFILQSAKEDNISIQFEQSLDSKGINKHVQNSYSVNEQYVAHPDTDIQTTFKDENGIAFSLKEYLEYLTNKIKTLEDIVYSAKGKLKVTIFNGIEEVEIGNNANMKIDFICQNNATSLDGVNYDNNLYLNTDYYIKLENISTSQLSFLVKDTYTSGNTIRTGTNNLPCLVNNEQKFIVQQSNQFIYFCDNANGVMLYSGTTSNTPSNGTYISSQITSSNYLPGMSGTYSNTLTSMYSVLGESHDGSTDWNIGSTLGTLICPSVKSIDDLIVKDNVGNNYKTLDSNNSIIIPLNIYWKFITSNVSTVNINNDISYIEHNKSLKVWLNPSSIGTVFQFIISFNIKSKKI